MHRDFVALAVLSISVFVSACSDDEGAAGTGGSGNSGNTGGGGSGASGASGGSGGTGGTGGGGASGGGGAGGMIVVDTCTEDLDPQEAPTNLVISEIDVGNFIELYNPTAAPIDIGASTAQWCSFPNYGNISTGNTGVVVPPGGYRAIPWPLTLVAATALTGELALYSDGNYASPTSVLDFVCWGTGNPGSTRKTTAEAAGEWAAAGPCASAPTNTATKREIGTDGDQAADWDSTVTGMADNCDP